MSEKRTIVEKIIGNHAGRPVRRGEIVDVELDARIARDFGGANVVKNIRRNGLDIDDPARTFFTFDCNPGGSDQGYAENQQICRVFARERGIRVHDITEGIGTHLAMETGLAHPGSTLVSTDSHANIVGAIGAFGQGMGDRDIAYAFANGKVWFKVPPTVRIVLSGRPDVTATAKDIILACLRRFGANGLLGCAAEYYGDITDSLGMAERITIASMATEMAGIISFFPPSQEILNYFGKQALKDFTPVYADPDAEYEREETIDIEGLKPLIARPGHPDDVAPVSELADIKVDSCFIGSCTNGAYEDMAMAAEILQNVKVAPGVVLKIVPATRKVWDRCLRTGILEIFQSAGALVGNAGCAGCAAGQIGQNGPGEITMSTGNRNFPGKQGKGSVYLASPAVVAASAVAGVISTPDAVPKNAVLFPAPSFKPGSEPRLEPKFSENDRPTVIRGRVWVIDEDNIDTDMIYHNRHLSVTDTKEMPKYAFGNLPGWEDFPQKARPGDIMVTGVNFGCGSSRQQAVDCFVGLGISLIIAQSYGAIYERNAVNTGMPVMTADLSDAGVKTGDEIEANLTTGEIIIINANGKVKGQAFSPVQMEIYQRGGLLS